MTAKPRTQPQNDATSEAAKGQVKSRKAKGAAGSGPAQTVLTAVKAHPILATAAGALAIGVGAYALTKSGSKPAKKAGRKQAGKAGKAGKAGSKSARGRRKSS